MLPNFTFLVHKYECITFLSFLFDIGYTGGQILQKHLTMLLWYGLPASLLQCLSLQWVRWPPHLDLSYIFHQVKYSHFAGLIHKKDRSPHGYRIPLHMETYIFKESSIWSFHSARTKNDERLVLLRKIYLNFFFIIVNYKFY